MKSKQRGNGIPFRTETRFAWYYSELYTSRNPQQDAIEEFMDHLSVPSITKVHQGILKTPITNLETLKAIVLLKTNQMPDPDGYTSELQFKNLSMFWVQNYKNFLLLVY